MTRVALVTCQHPPEPDHDQSLLIEALHQAGMSAEAIAWDADGVAWSEYDLAVIRSTWDYFRARGRFLEWAERVSAETLLLNPFPILRWNTHKRYLEDLESAGIPIVPTVFVEGGTSPDLAVLFADSGLEQVVIKPAVSAGSYRTARFDRQDLVDAEAHLAGILEAGDAMIQPYLSAVETTGERAVVWIDGVVTHSVRKQPRFGRDDESVSGALAVDPEEQAFAERVLTLLPPSDPLLYARIDMARDDKGILRLMELEVTEPSLFLLQHPPAMRRLVMAIGRAAAGRAGQSG